MATASTYCLPKNTIMETYNIKNITKVMRFSAIACPCIIPSTGKMFDSKIGIWAFAKERPTACSSKNCPKGKMEWH